MRLWRWALAPAAGVCLLAVFCRTVPLYLSLSCLALSVGTLLRFGRDTLRVLFSKRLAINVMVLVVSACISGVLAELAARHILPRDATEGWLYQYDPRCTFLLRPGGFYDAVIQVSQTEQKVIQQRVSSQGVRDRVYASKRPDEYRILMLGDSHTFGVTVPEDETIPKQLEQLLASERLPKHISVINAGLCAAGPQQELGMLLRFGLALEPDLVVLQLYPENDVDDSLATIGKVQRAYNLPARQLRWMFQQQALFPVRAERWTSLHSRLYRAVKRVLNRYDLIVTAFRHLRFYPEFDMPPLPRSEKRRFDLEVNLKEWYPELEEGMSLVEKYVLDIRAECRKHNLDLIVYSIPCLKDLKNCHDPDVLKSYEEPCLYERYKALRRVDAFLQKEDIPAFSVVAALEAPERVKEVYYVLDGHLNPRGNAVVAAVIRDYLAGTYFRASDRFATAAK